MVGAGPGGCATALHLARRGHHVRVVDRGLGRPGGKVCGEGLMPHGLAALRRLGMSTEGLGQRFVGIAYHAGDDCAVGHFPGRRWGLGVRRDGLDARMRQAVAAEPRIEFESDVRVTGMTRDRSGVTLATSRGPMRTRVVVGADGLHSTVRRLAKLDAGSAARRGRRYGARVHLQLARGLREPDHVNVYAGGGSEAYITPVGPQQINLALLCEAEVARSFKGDREGQFRRVAERYPLVRELLRGAEPLSEVAVCGPLRQTVKGCATDHVVLVGDAAGFVDAVTGEGMSLTLLSAEIAAEAVSAALHRGSLRQRDLASYARRRLRLLRDLCTLTEVVVFGLRHPAWAARVVRALGHRPRAFEQFLAVQTGQGRLWSLGPAVASVAWALWAGPSSPNRQLATS